MGRTIQSLIQKYQSYLDRGQSNLTELALLKIKGYRAIPPSEDAGNSLGTHFKGFKGNVRYVSE